MTMNGLVVSIVSFGRSIFSKDSNNNQDASVQAVKASDQERDEVLSPFYFPQHRQRDNLDIFTLSLASNNHK